MFFGRSNSGVSWQIDVCGPAQMLATQNLYTHFGFQHAQEFIAQVNHNFVV